MSIDLSQFHGMFFQESCEAVNSIEAGCLAFDMDAKNNEAINAVFRAAHSIKGGSATFGFSQVAEFTHVLESILDELRSDERQLSQPVVDVLLSSVDGLRAMLAAAQLGKTLDAAEFTRYQRALEAIIVDPSTVVKSSERQIGKEVWHADAAVHDLNAEKTTFLQSESLSQPSKKVKLESAETKALTLSSAKLPGVASGGLDGKTVRVEMEKIDLLINLVGEIVITQSMINLLSEDQLLRNHDPLQQGLLELQRQTRLLQEGVLQIRMLPIALCFDRYPRMVRDISSQLGKRIKLVINGENTEVDKTVIEGITDPLLHLVRNSIDHGIEAPDQRRLKGKAECGCITISACHRAGHIVIEVDDDGRGLNARLLTRKAKEKALVAAQSELTDPQAFELIFLPGFSTCDEVNDLSGRGVGMDVVKRNIQALGGVIKLKSELNKGTRFTIKLPITLAIMEGQLVRIGNENYVIPLIKIIESLQPEAAMIDCLTDTIKFRDSYLPVARLSELLETPDADPTRRLTEGVVVIVESKFGCFGLFVDELLAQQQIVIKPLEEHYQPVRGISGATILGNGRIALILDVDKLHQPLNDTELDCASAG